MKQQTTITILRWTARILAAMIALLLIVFFIGEGFTANDLTRTEIWMFGALFVSWCGMLIGWKWEGIGGTLNILGFAVFYILNYLEASGMPRGWVFPAMALPGLLFLVCRVASRKK